MLTEIGTKIRGRIVQLPRNPRQLKMKEKQCPLIAGHLGVLDYTLKEPKRHLKGIKITPKGNKTVI